MYAPFAFFVKKGYGSKYLTGLFTPEGITFWAMLNNFLELDKDIIQNWSLLFVI